MPQDPIKPFLDKIAELLKFAELNASKPLGEFSPEIRRRVDKLRNDIDKYEEMTSSYLAEQGVDTSEIIHKFRQNPKQFPPHIQRMIKYCLDLGLNAVILRAALAQAQQPQPPKKLDTSKTSKKAIKKRAKKFKGLDGDSKWKRL